MLRYAGSPAVSAKQPASSAPRPPTTATMAAPKSVASSAGAMGANEVVFAANNRLHGSRRGRAATIYRRLAAPNTRTTLDPLTPLTRC
jgi:hypothetical protein